MAEGRRSYSPRLIPEFWLSGLTRWQVRYGANEDSRPASERTSEYSRLIRRPSIPEMEQHSDHSTFVAEPDQRRAN